MLSSPNAWRASAAYLYVLHLDGPGLAWEYLRRNASYQSTWEQRQHPYPTATAQRWRLEDFEHSGRDARVVLAFWDGAAAAVLALPVFHDGAKSTPLSIWRLAGHRRMYVGKHCTTLIQNSSGRTLCIHLLPGFKDGSPCICVALNTGPQTHRRKRGDSARTGLINTARPFCACTGTPDRQALAHLRTLQAIDGRAAGATHRQLAEVLFGADAAQADWHADSALRARVRHLLTRGRQLVEGQYVALLGDKSASESGTDRQHVRSHRSAA